MIENIARKNRFTTNAALNDRIAYLENLKEKQEQRLQDNLVEIHKSLQPIELVKNAIDKIRHDVEVGQKTGGLVGSIAVNYIASRLVKDKRTPIGFLKSLVVEQLASAVYRKNEKKINGLVRRVTSRWMHKLHILEDAVPDYVADAKALRENRQEQNEIEQKEDKEFRKAAREEHISDDPDFPHKEDVTPQEFKGHDDKPFKKSEKDKEEEE